MSAPIQLALIGSVVPLTAIPVRVEMPGLLVVGRAWSMTTAEASTGAAGETLPARSVIEPAFSSRVTDPLPQPLTPTV